MFLGPCKPTSERTSRPNGYLRPAEGNARTYWITVGHHKHMNVHPEKNASAQPAPGNLTGFIRDVLFFALFYLYVWIVVDVRLIYHASAIVPDNLFKGITGFFCEWTFFSRFMSFPGGPVQYVCTFLVQFFSLAWAGALVITLQAWLIAVCTDKIISALGMVRFRWIKYVGPTLILITYTLYFYRFVDTMALLVALSFSCLYLKTRSMRQVYCACIFVALSVVLYYLAAGVSACFAVICVIWELFFTRRWRLGLFFIVIGSALPWIEGVLVFGVNGANAYSDLTPWMWKHTGPFLVPEIKYVRYMLHLMIPVFMLCSAIVGVVFRSKSVGEPPVKNQESGELSAIQRFATIRSLWWAVRTAALFLVAGASVVYFHDPNRKAILAIDYCNHYRMWPELLRDVDRFPNNIAATGAINRALYHTGTLGSDMFKYPQHPDRLFLTADIYSTMPWMKYDVYMDLGLLNLAEDYLTVTMGHFSDHPVVLKQLAKLNMAQGDMATARVYLGALSKTILFNDWADEYLAKIEKDPTLEKDGEIQKYRSVSIEKDDLMSFFSVETFLLALLEKNPDNRMAFEYLLAHYMLNKNIKEFMNHIGRLDDFGYTQTPRYYEEVIMIYNNGHPRNPFVLSGRPVSVETRKRVRHVSRIRKRYRDNKRAAYTELESEYGDSYFFYFFFSELQASGET
jgi:hypothetical protein